MRLVTVTRNERPTSALAKTVSLLLALMPPARMAWVVFTNGENNLSNDYGLRVPLVVSMLDGTCSLAKYFREAWVAGGHSMLALIPIYYLNARFLDWSVWVELGLGLALVAATVALLAGAIPRSARWLLLPLLSLLLFSTSRVTVFTFGEPALQYGISQLGVAIGAFALARWPDRPIPLAQALAFGGILASWSWAGGIMAWPVFAVALVLLRVRSPVAWTLFLSGAVVGVAQYAWLLFLRAPGSTAMKTSPGLNFRAILDLLGRPFVNGTARDYGPSLTSQILGLAGLAMLAILLYRGRGVSQRAPALAVIAWSLLVAIQIGMFRPEVAPWYVNPMALFWAGLALLLAPEPVPFRGGGIAVIALLALLVQPTWEDKSFYLSSRSPASAACLREWRTAPPGCGERLFQWGGGGAPPAWLGEPLDRHHLSVFGRRRTYLLQGDVEVGRVALEPSSLPAFFSRDGVTPADPNDFRRLDLVLAPGAPVTWRVDLPPNLKSAQFRTRVHAAPGDEMLARGARVSVTVEGSSVLLEERAFLPRETARPLSVDLSSLAGKRVTLRLEVEETHEGETPLVFEAPKIELRVEE
jgi:hypothetical protein